ncbi:ergothioneine biosynthesis protein EgtB [Microbulbifer discodermiae]|uniref:ergothioneine biosynthesis protein EgtB n=1 Tax=Microbulbifer sp. 2201CG32-9 TaxID=3232309 RepID=UPI00345BDE2D
MNTEVQVEVFSRYQRIRGETEHLAEPLSAEDMQLQSMPDASPGKWHLAHTSWFFETFVLQQQSGYRSFDPAFHQLFNSYYNSLGTAYKRSQRGLLSRPHMETVLAYRKAVDTAVTELLENSPLKTDTLDLLVLGLNHEQQHQELLLTDIKHAFSLNPAFPAYTDSEYTDNQGELSATALDWLEIPAGVYGIGSEGEHFFFDNEGPAHQHLVGDYRIASRLVTNGEYLEFIQDGGYLEPRLWLSDGWALLQQQNLRHPAYWHEREGQWYQFTLSGLQPLHSDEPVCHLNYYEADAYATWAGNRLPTEFEWEVAAYLLRQPDQLASANLLESRAYQPLRSRSGRHQFIGDLWEWTSSAYLPYPGFKARVDAIGEYNGKFMCNQKVLRGGSCITPADHIRLSYRNFFYPHQSWQFTGLRLAGDLS